MSKGSLEELVKELRQHADTLGCLDVMLTGQGRDALWQKDKQLIEAAAGMLEHVRIECAVADNEGDTLSGFVLHTELDHMAAKAMHKDTTVSPEADKDAQEKA